jgi:hypothetical protein
VEAENMQKNTNKSNWKALKLWPLVTIALVLLTGKNLVSVALAKSENASIKFGSPSNIFANPWTIQRISVSSLGVQGNNNSEKPSISDDGNLVAFIAYANNLIPNDLNSSQDAFVANLSTGEIILVSKNTNGTQANSFSSDVAISGNGRYVAFTSAASNLVTGDANEKSDVFVHDVDTGITTLVSISTAGVHGNRESQRPSISDDGRYVAFESCATNLLIGYPDEYCSIYLRDRLNGTTSLLSVSSSGEVGNGDSTDPEISGDGNYVTFSSLANNLVHMDTNEVTDIFLHDNLTGDTERASVSYYGDQGNHASEHPALSDDGRIIVFESDASNLFPDYNYNRDIYWHDRLMQITWLASINSTGDAGNGYSCDPIVSDDGRYVGFNSDSTNLTEDISTSGGFFIRDLLDWTTQKISPNNERFGNPSISADGSTIAFDSNNSDLVAGDTNQATDIFVISNLPKYTLFTNISGIGSGTVSSNPFGIDCGQVCSFLFRKNSNLSLTAFPAPGSSFVSWTGDINSQDNPVEVTMDADKSITATFDLDEYSLSITSDHGTVTKSPDQATYHYGDVVQLTAEADPTYAFAYWSGTETGSANPFSTTIHGDTILTAHYLQSAHPLTITSAHGTVIKQPDQAVYLNGDIVQLNAIPDPGAQFDHWSGDITGNQNPTAVTINGDTSVTANYLLDEYTLSITSVHGTVTREPDQPTYHYGDVIHLSASPDPDYSFTGWSGGATSATNPMEFTIHENTALTANFVLNTYLLTVVKTGKGTGTVTSSPSGIDCGSDCSQIYSAGTNVTLTATTITPLTTFTGWTGGGCIGADTCIVELHSDVTITADFMAYRLYIPAVAKPVPPPDPFNKINPSDGSTDVSNRPTLYWSSSATATNYEYCIDTTNNSTCDSSWISVGMYTNATPIGLTSSTTYYWQVRARNVGGVTYANNGNWYSFATRWGPKPGFWWDNTTGTYFFVTPDQAIVREFSIYVYIEDCYDGWISRTYPAGDVNISSDNTFSFSGPLYASGTFDLETTAHGQMGLSHFGPLCGYYWSGGPFNWSAVWLDSTQPTASELRALEANVRHVLRGTNPPIFFTPDKK